MTESQGEGRTHQVEAHELGGRAPTGDIAAAAETAERVIENVARVIHAPRSLIARCVMAILCEGHIILEDFPGVGKTMLAKSLARSLDCEFARVQATPDLLPSDVTGVSVFNLQGGNEFEFKPGPVFANLVLVDEINRASPKTQSALLECMQEVQVTVDGVTHPLARPFMVIATQNPIEYEGTFPLPEAQLDRFAMRLTLGYPDARQEARMLSEHAAGEPIDELRPVSTAADIEAAIAAVKGVFVEESLHRYVVAILNHTRSDTRLSLGASPRAGISLLRVAKAHAALEGRDYVSPADIKAVAEDVLSHRVILAPEARTAGIDAADSIREALERTAIPV
jgi:MoxR-like ATPase